MMRVIRLIQKNSQSGKKILLQIMLKKKIHLENIFKYLVMIIHSIIMIPKSNSVLMVVSSYKLKVILKMVCTLKMIIDPIRY